MRPPICDFCDRRFSPEEGGLVTFKPRSEDLPVLQKFDEPGYTGHPPNVGWFCGDHIEAARASAALTLGEALSGMAETKR